MTVTKKAQHYLDQFETGKRDGGESFVHLKSERDEVLQDSIREAHGDLLPDDWVYGTYADLLSNITEYDCDTIDDLDDVRHEIVDSYVDVYTHDLTAWLHSHNSNVYYLDEARELNPEGDGFQLLMAAQYAAIDEIFGHVYQLLEGDI